MNTVAPGIEREAHAPADIEIARIGAGKSPLPVRFPLEILAEHTRSPRVSIDIILPERLDTRQVETRIESEIREHLIAYAAVDTGEHGIRRKRLELDKQAVVKHTKRHAVGRIRAVDKEIVVIEIPSQLVAHRDLVPVRLEGGGIFDAVPDKRVCTLPCRERILIGTEEIHRDHIALRQEERPAGQIVARRSEIDRNLLGVHDRIANPLRIRYTAILLARYQVIDKTAVRQILLTDMIDRSKESAVVRRLLLQHTVGADTVVTQRKIGGGREILCHEHVHLQLLARLQGEERPPVSQLGIRILGIELRNVIRCKRIREVGLHLREDAIHVPLEEIGHLRRRADGAEISRIHVPAQERIIVEMLVVQRIDALQRNFVETVLRRPFEHAAVIERIIENECLQHSRGVEPHAVAVLPADAAFRLADIARIGQIERQRIVERLANRIKAPERHRIQVPRAQRTVIRHQRIQRQRICDHLQSQAVRRVRDGIRRRQGRIVRGDIPIRAASQDCKLSAGGILRPGVRPRAGLLIARSR